MSNTLHATIATDAPTMAVKRRSPPIGLVHHSNRGVQYECHACRELLEEHGMAQIMSRAGNCYDNAMMESLCATLKKELVHDQHFRTHDEARAAIFQWIEALIPTNQNPRLTRLRQPRSVRGDREGWRGSSWMSMIGVQVQRARRGTVRHHSLTQAPVTNHAHSFLHDESAWCAVGHARPPAARRRR